MKVPCLLSAAAACCIVHAEVPSIGNVAFSYGGGRRPAVVTYTLTGAPAFVTVDIETNTLADATGEWVGIGGEATGGIYGQGAALVWVTNKMVKAYWLPGDSWPGQTLPAGVIRARLTAYPTNSPPDYMVVDLSSPTNRHFYSCEKSLPGGIDSDLYRTNSMVMRRIPAANVVWRMGIPSGEDGASTINAPHKVLLTEDYYMGVFELTQGQYKTATGNNPSTYRSYDDSPWRPVENIKGSTLRGQTYSDENDPYGWPREDHAVSPTSAIGKMRRLTGLSMLDIPTDAQWEYACRAGTGTMINTGKSNPATADWKEVAYYSGTTPQTNKNYTTATVGQLIPNNWGLYDMHGNVLEVCLDWYEGDGAPYVATFQAGWETGAVTTNPVGIAWADASLGSSRNIVKRGGSIAHALSKGMTYSGFRSSGGIEYASYYIGCRLVCPLSDVVPEPPAESGDGEEEVTE